MNRQQGASIYKARSARLGSGWEPEKSLTWRQERPVTMLPGPS